MFMIYVMIYNPHVSYEYNMLEVHMTNTIDK